MAATGRIPESRFKLLLKTKDVPEEDVKEMLEGDEKFDSYKCNWKHQLLQNTKS